MVKSIIFLRLVAILVVVVCVTACNWKDFGTNKQGSSTEPSQRVQVGGKIPPLYGVVRDKNYDERLNELLARGVGIARDDKGDIVAIKLDNDHGNDFDRLIVNVMPKIETVQEAYCDWSDISSKGLEALSEKCPNLTLIDIRDCVRIDDDDAEELLSFKKLREVYVHWSSERPAGVVRTNIARFNAVLGGRVHVGSTDEIGAWREQMKYGLSAKHPSKQALPSTSIH